MRTTDLTRSIAGFAVCAAVILTGACGGQAALNRQPETMYAGQHTACLKRGLAAGTEGHTECVLALYEERQEREVRLRGSVEPVQPIDSGEAFPPAY